MAIHDKRENIEKNIDWFLLSLVAATPACLLQERPEIIFEKIDIPGEVLVEGEEADFGEFHDGTYMYDRSREDLVEYAKKYMKELRGLSFELAVRANQIARAIAVIEEE